MPWLILTLKLFETLFFQTNSNCRTCFWHFLFSCRGSIHLCATFPWTAIFVEHTTHIPTSSYHFMAIGSNIISTTSFGINNSYEQFGSWAFRFVDRGDSCTCARSVHGTWDNMSKELHGIWHRYGIVMTVVSWSDWPMWQEAQLMPQIHCNDFVIKCPAFLRHVTRVTHGFPRALMLAFCWESEPCQNSFLKTFQTSKLVFWGTWHVWHVLKLSSACLDLWSPHPPPRRPSPCALPDPQMGPIWDRSLP